MELNKNRRYEIILTPAHKKIILTSLKLKNDLAFGSSKVYLTLLKDIFSLKDTEYIKISKALNTYLSNINKVTSFKNKKTNTFRFLNSVNYKLINTTKYKITITEEDLYEIITSTELTMRLLSGQLKDIESSYIWNKDIDNSFLEDLKSIFQEVIFKPNVRFPDLSEMCYDIYQSTRYTFYWTKFPKGGFQVYFDKPLKKSKLELIEVKSLMTENVRNIFIATPMSAFTVDEYEQLQKTILNYKEKSIDNVFSEITNISVQNNFISPEMGTRRDLLEIEKSDFFILIHPKKIQSSTLFELGIAFNQNKEILILFKNKEDIPYMLQELDLISNKVSLEYYNNKEDIIKKINYFIKKD